MSDEINVKEIDLPDNTSKKPWVKPSVETVVAVKKTSGGPNPSQFNFENLTYQPS